MQPDFLGVNDKSKGSDGQSGDQESDEGPEKGPFGFVEKVFSVIYDRGLDDCADD